MQRHIDRGIPHLPLNITYNNVTTWKRYFGGFYLGNQLYFSSIRITMDKSETIEEGLEINFIYK